MNKEIFEELWMIVDRLESNITNIFISKEEMEHMISEISSLIEDLDEERVEKILNMHNFRVSIESKIKKYDIKISFIIFFCCLILGRDNFVHSFTKKLLGSE